jgi:hypothetical protein
MKSIHDRTQALPDTEKKTHLSKAQILCGSEGRLNRLAALPERFVISMKSRLVYSISAVTTRLPLDLINSGILEARAEIRQALWGKARDARIPSRMPSYTGHVHTPPLQSLLKSPECRRSTLIISALIQLTSETVKPGFNQDFVYYILVFADTKITFFTNSKNLYGH